MAITGWKYPTADGAIKDEWLNPSRCYVEDSLRATYNNTTGDEEDFYHFDFQDDIAETATIDGIEVQLNGYSKNGTGSTLAIRLVIGGSAAGDTKNVSWTSETSDTKKTAGGASDKWGLTPTAAQVRADNFGVLCDCTAVGAEGVGYINDVAIRISYTSTVDVSVDALTLASSVPDPSISAPGTANTDADALTLASSTPAATISVPGTASTSADALTLAGTTPAATITAPGTATVSADALTLASSALGATISEGQEGQITAVQAGITYTEMTGRVTATKADLTYTPMTGRVTAIGLDITYTETGPPSSPAGTIYYIKDAAEGGNDAAAGTSWATAWATLDHVANPSADVLSDVGDTVVIRPRAAGAAYYPTITLKWWHPNLTFISEEKAVSLGIIPGPVGRNGNAIIDGTNQPADSDVFITRPHISYNPTVGEFDCSGASFIGLTIRNAKRHGIYAWILAEDDRDLLRDLYVGYCNIHTIYECGVLFIHADDAVFEWNEQSNCSTNPAHYGTSHPNYFSNCNNVTIQDNTIHDTGGIYGAYVNGSSVNNIQTWAVNPTVRRNTLYGCKYGGIGVYNVKGGRVENNLIYSSVPYYAEHVSIRVGVQGELLGYPSAPSEAVTICNNTIVESDANQVGIELVHYLNGDAPICSKNCVVFNNIVITATGLPATAIKYSELGDHTVDPSNVIAPYTTDNLTRFFVNAAGYDFHPKSTADFVDKGVESCYNEWVGRMLSPLEDLETPTTFRVRPLGRHTDPGCYEYNYTGTLPLDYAGRITAVKATLTHSTSVIPFTPVAPLQTFIIPDWRLEFKSWGGTFKDIIQKASGFNAMVRLDFELLRDGGCGDGSITLMRERVPGPPRSTQFGYNIDPGDIVDVYLRSWYFGDQTTKWYRGVVTKVDDTEGFGETITIKTQGLWDFLSRRYVTKYYEGKAVNLMVADILADVYADSGLSASTSGIQIQTPYTIGDVELELTSVSDAIRSLASVQQAVQYGVDQDGILYFKDLTTQGMLTKQVGVNVSAYEKWAESDDLTNHYLLQAKQLLGGANLILSKESATSIASYGRRTKLIQATGLQDLDDLTRYGEALLADTADPNTHVDVNVVGDVYYLFPRGNCKIIKLDKTFMDLPIQSVKYTFADQATMKLGLGDAPETKLPEEVRRIYRDISVGKASSLSNVKVEHTKNEEWAQSVRIDAGKQGNLTLFYDTFESDRGLGDGSTGYVHDGTIGAMRNRLPAGAIPYTDMYTPAVDIGAVVDTVRVHLWIDQVGAIEFNNSNVLREYFSDSNQTWEVEGGVLSCANRTDPIFWAYEPQQPGASYTIHAWITSGIVDDVTHFQDILFNYVDENNYGGVRLSHHGTSVWSVKVFKYVSGVYSDSTGDDFDVPPVKVTVAVADDPTTTVATVYDTYGNAIATDSLAVAGYTAGDATLRTWGLRGWDNPAGLYIAKAGWVETGGAFTVYVKRNTGTGWVTAVTGLVTDGEVNTDVDVSSQAAGTTIQMRCYMRGNMALRGWGWSADTT